MPHFIFCFRFDKERIIDYERSYSKLKFQQKSSVTPKAFSVYKKYLFNHDFNRGCLAYMFSLRFSGSKFLLNLRPQFSVRKIFSQMDNFPVHKFWRDLQFFHFMFKIIISKMRDLCSRLLFYIKTRSLIFCYSGIVFSRSNGLIISMFDELEEVKYFKEACVLI